MLRAARPRLETIPPMTSRLQTPGKVLQTTRTRKTTSPRTIRTISPRMTSPRMIPRRMTRTTRRRTTPKDDKLRMTSPRTTRRRTSRARPRRSRPSVRPSSRTRRPTSASSTSGAAPRRSPAGTASCYTPVRLRQDRTKTAAHNQSAALCRVEVPSRTPSPGDLIWIPGHIGIISETKGQMYDAGSTRTNTTKRSYSWMLNRGAKVIRVVG